LGGGRKSGTTLTLTNKTFAGGIERGGAGGARGGRREWSLTANVKKKQPPFRHLQQEGVGDGGKRRSQLETQGGNPITGGSLAGERKNKNGARSPPLLVRSLDVTKSPKKKDLLRNPSAISLNKKKLIIGRGGKTGKKGVMEYW